MILFAVMLLRYVDVDLVIHQRLVHLGHYAAAFNNRELARVINRLLSITLHVRDEHVVQFQLDRAEAGLVAVDTLQTLYSNAAAGSCLSHTLDHCGEHVLLPTARKFFNSLNSLMSSSHQAQGAWKGLTGNTFGSKSKTRYYEFVSVYHCLRHPGLVASPLALYLLGLPNQ